MPETPEDAALVEAMLAAWHLGGDDVSMGDGMRAVLALVRENIAQGIDDEADVTPCAEDATVTRGVAQLVRVGFSYDAADAREEEIATLTASLAEAEARAGRAEAAIAEVASEALSTEIPEGYGPDIAENPEFHRGYDAAISRLRALAALQETPHGR